LYADDILLLSPTVSGLQNMLDKCAEVASILSLGFNVAKSQCVVIGKMCKSEIMPMNLNGNDVLWCDTIKYLGVHLQSDRCVKFNISHTKRISMRRVTQFFYIVMALMILHCCICKSPIVFQLLCMPFLPCRLLIDKWRN